MTAEELKSQDPLKAFNARQAKRTEIKKLA
jgi:hypothetical protein